MPTPTSNQDRLGILIVSKGTPQLRSHREIIVENWNEINELPSEPALFLTDKHQVVDTIDLTILKHYPGVIACFWDIYHQGLTRYNLSTSEHSLSRAVPYDVPFLVADASYIKFVPQVEEIGLTGALKLLASKYRTKHVADPAFNWLHNPDPQAVDKEVKLIHECYSASSPAR